MKEIAFETYPPCYWDYDRGIENDDYDETIIVFTVPYDWFLDWIKREDEDMTEEEFMDEYDWDWTEAMREDAYRENVVLKEEITYRNGDHYEKPIATHKPTGKEIVLSLDSWEAEWLYNTLDEHASNCKDAQDSYTARSICNLLEKADPTIRLW